MGHFLTALSLFLLQHSIQTQQTPFICVTVLSAAGAISIWANFGNFGTCHHSIPEKLCHWLETTICCHLAKPREILINSLRFPLIPHNEEKTFGNSVFPGNTILFKLANNRSHFLKKSQERLLLGLPPESRTHKIQNVLSWSIYSKVFPA